MVLEHHSEKTEQLGSPEQLIRKGHLLCIHHAENNGHKGIRLVEAENRIVLCEADFPEKFGDTIAAAPDPAIFPGGVVVCNVSGRFTRIDQEGLAGLHGKDFSVIIINAGSTDDHMDQIGCSDKRPCLVSRTTLLVSAIVDMIGRGSLIVILNIRHQSRRKTGTGNCRERMNFHDCSLRVVDNINIHDTGPHSTIKKVFPIDFTITRRLFNVKGRSGRIRIAGHSLL